MAKNIEMVKYVLFKTLDTFNIDVDCGKLVSMDKYCVVSVTKLPLVNYTATSEYAVWIPTLNIHLYFYDSNLIEKVHTYIYSNENVLKAEANSILALRSLKINRKTFKGILKNYSAKDGKGVKYDFTEEFKNEYKEYTKGNLPKWFKEIDVEVNV